MNTRGFAILAGITASSAVVNSRISQRASGAVAIATLGATYWLIRNDLHSLSMVTSAASLGATYAYSSRRGSGKTK